MARFFAGWEQLCRKKPLRGPFVVLVIQHDGPGVAERASV